MKRKQMILWMLGIITILAVGFLFLRQPKQIADDIKSHDTTYYQELIAEKKTHSDGITEVLNNLPRNAKLKQTSSLINNEGAFFALGIAFETGANVHTMLYDVCLLSAFYEDVDTITISFEDKEKELKKKSIEQFMKKDLTHETLEVKEQWDKINKSIQELDEGIIEAFLF